MAVARIGTSGWNYKHWWNGVFYDKSLKPAEWLRFYAQYFDTVEINSSFYRLPTEEAFQKWKGEVPPRFTFAVKASRFLTHIKRLKDPADPIDLFLSRAKHLKSRLGPILFQLPPQFKIDLERLEAFLEALRAHPVGKKARCVLEVRNATWLVPEFFEMLRRFKVCLCFADWKDLHVSEPVTADFVYVRRHHGKGAGGNYRKQDLQHDVTQIRKWLRDGLDVYVYFNNDAGGHALRNAQFVQKMLTGRHRRDHPLVA